MADVTKSRITAAEFYELPEQTGFPIVELIDGEIILTPARYTQHQRVLQRVMVYLGKQIPDGELLPLPIPVEFDEYNILEPDLIWISEMNAPLVTDTRIGGAPDLVVEVHSEDTIKRDRTKKLGLYEQHGVREYWMIDPEYEQVEVWVNGADGFSRLGLYGKMGTFTSPTLGKLVDLSPVFP